MTDDIDVPEEEGEGIPVTYVPARNTIMLSLALAWAEVLGADDIFIGVNAVDYSGYPDCRPSLSMPMKKWPTWLPRLVCTGNRLTIHTPLIDLSKADIIRQGTELGVDYAHDSFLLPGRRRGQGMRCVRFLPDTCYAGFEAAGVSDPTRYQS